MAKLPPFEEWTRPWKDDEFDAEKAAKLIYNLHKDKETLTEARSTLQEENTELKGKVTEFEEKDLSEVERLRRENERIKGEGGKKDEASSSTDLLAERYRIALEKGLSASAARRLAGTTVEELEADAEAYIEETGLGGSNNGAGGQAPPSQRPKPKVRTGSQQSPPDPDPDDDLDPGALYDKVFGSGSKTGF